MELKNQNEPPLEGFYYFVRVVEAGGFARAARVLQIPRSRVSRQIQGLEARLGVRLVSRSTRRFAVTDVGQEVYRHAVAMLAQADAAVDAVEFLRAEPRGVLKVGCPVGLAQSLAPVLPEFLRRYPQVRLQLHVSNRRIDVVAEGFDLALRVRSQPSGEDGLVMRSFGETEELLVASPEYLQHAPPLEQPAQLAGHDSLDYAGEFDRRTWQLSGPGGESVSVTHNPRVICHDFAVMRATVRAGLGVARMPESIVREDLRSGALVRVLPQWKSPQGILHVVFPSRRGLLPSVRACIDFLAQRLPQVI